MPTSLNLLNTLRLTFSNCYELESVTFPSTMNAVTTMQSTFNGCWSLKNVTLPASMSSCTVFAQTFQNCYSIKGIAMPGIVSANTTTYAQLTDTCPALEYLYLPTTATPLVTSIANMFNACGSLTIISQEGKIGSTTATPLVIATNGVSFCSSNLITSLSFRAPFSRLTFNGTSATQNFNKLNSLRLLNASAGQYTGASPQINVSYCDLGVAALDQLFTDLPVVVGKTINITGCTGAAGCTRTIATLKGWTVTG